MSVFLNEATDIARIAHSLEEHGVKPRDVWYAYISNVTSYNVQYKEDAPIDFKAWEAYDEDTEQKLPFIDALKGLGGLLYNSCTNAGNYFMPKSSLDRLERFYETFKSVIQY